MLLIAYFLAGETRQGLHLKKKRSKKPHSRNPLLYQKMAGKSFHVMLAMAVVIALASTRVSAFSAPASAFAFRSGAMKHATTFMHNHAIPLRQAALRGGRASMVKMSGAVSSAVGAKLTPATAGMRKKKNSSAFFVHVIVHPRYEMK
jgi:hypothetical protein